MAGADMKEKAQPGVCMGARAHPWCLRCPPKACGHCCCCYCCWHHHRRCYCCCCCCWRPRRLRCCYCCCCCCHRRRRCCCYCCCCWRPIRHCCCCCCLQGRNTRNVSKGLRSTHRQYCNYKAGYRSEERHSTCRNSARRKQHCQITAIGFADGWLCNTSKGMTAAVKVAGKSLLLLE